MDALEILLVATIIFFAGIVRGFIGFGFSLIAAPTLAIFFPPLVIVPIILFLDFAAGIIAGLRDRKHVDHRLLLWLSIPCLVLTPFGAWVLHLVSDDTARIGIALTVLIAVGVMTLRPNTFMFTNSLAAISAGGSSGLINGALGMGSPPIALFLLSANLGASSVRATAILFFLIADAGAIISNTAMGNIGKLAIQWSVIGLPFMLLGERIGTHFFRIHGNEAYRKSVFTLLTLSSAVLIIRTLMGS